MKPSDYKAIRELRRPSDIFDLSGRAGLIVGGAGKMGQEFASTLSNSGATVLIADLAQTNIEHVASKLDSGEKGEVLGRECDIADRDQVKALFAEIDQEYGQLDFLICNVMAKPEGYYRPFDDYDPDTWREVIDANLTGVFFCSQEAARLMRRQGSGSIVLTSSIYGMTGPDQRIYRGCSPAKNPYGGADPLNAPAAYSASKGGVNALAQYLATLLGPDQVRVNVLVPGGVYDGQEESFHDAYIDRTPLMRMAVWSDYNGAILFLVSDASRYMTGAKLVIDGGWSAW
ncbi:MAG TPA: SDR family oxidoreductase [Acidiferrobacteraceae bacterium]|nr:SDR family oxidoreductase [Acidiferrobacteraceae bacterium]